MKQKVYPMNNAYCVDQLIKAANSTILDGSIEFVARNAQRARSLQQFGALFGIWLVEMCDQAPGNDKEYIHQWAKGRFLVPIYADNPIGDWQEQWAALYWYCMEQCDPSIDEKLRKPNAVELLAEHISRITMSDLSGITKDQLKTYMDDLYGWSINNGFKLTEPQKFHAEYRAEIKRQRGR